jgi:glycosyltransferase involved in cell wall biosynthesis
VKITYDNIIFSLQKAGGISVYWYEMVRRLMGHSQNVSFIEQKNASENIFRQMLYIPPELVINAERGPRFLTRYLNPDVRLDPGTIFHSSYYRTHPDPRVLSIITVHDFIYERYRSGLPRIVHHQQKKRAIQNAAGIICISNSTSRDLIGHFPDTRADMVKTIYLSASETYNRINLSEDISPMFRDLLGKNVILFVGERAGYKKFDVAVETVRSCKGAFLVTVGGQPFAEKELAQIEASMEGRFRHYSGLNNAQLNQIYNLAFCLLYPSTYEGFGIPVIEAMQAGCPVVVANRSSLPEVCGDACLMVNELSPHGFADKIKELNNRSFRDEVVQRGLQQAAKFSWDRTFRETFEFYKYIHSQTIGKKQNKL